VGKHHHKSSHAVSGGDGKSFCGIEFSGENIEYSARMFCVNIGWPRIPLPGGRMAWKIADEMLNIKPHLMCQAQRDCVTK
jgi:hypothetical protein